MKLAMMVIGLLTGLSVMVGCTNSGNFEKQMAETLDKHPELVLQVIEKNPEKFMQTVQAAARKARPQQQGNGQEDVKKQIDEEFKSPKTPEVEEARIVGKADAPILIVEYSDLECPFCARGNATLEEVKKMYGDKVKVIFKHLPLEMHPNARPAARYYEAIVAADGQAKAYAWSQKVFEAAQSNPGLFRSGDVNKMFEEMAKKAGVSVAKVKKNLKDAQVMAKADVTIQKDTMEARNFGIQGTPGFLINGVTIRGAYPAQVFKEIIDRHLEAKK